MELAINEVEIRKTISVLKPQGELFEVRLIDNKWNASGYFSDADTLLREMKRIKPRQNANYYFTLNIVKDECYSRKQRDRLVEYASPNTSDLEIARLIWLMVDFDPKRASGVSSSDEQLEQAHKKAGDVYRYLCGRGWTKPVVAMSGNGYHLLYRVELLNTKENVERLKNCLLALHMLFSDDEIEIDLKTFNPARVCKLYGTISKKGASTSERPHRMSRLVHYPDQILPTDVSLLDELISVLPKEEAPKKYNNYSPREFDLEAWITRYGLRYSSKTAWNGGTKWILDECPFNSSHAGKDASIIQTADGKICFNCFHNSCADKHWRELRLKFEPDAYEQKYVESKAYPNYKNENYVVEKVTEEKVINGKPVFYTTEQIRLLDTPPLEFIRTGIKIIDRKMRGLQKGAVTCMSGLRGCGKSSIISQFTIEAVDQGYKVALFSGELTAKNTYNWLMLQGAGKEHIVSTQYENFFEVNKAQELQISTWLNDRVYIYNNEYGNNFDELLAHLDKCVVEHKVDLILIDNLMALNINMLDRDKYQQQSAFVMRLERFAKRNNVHVLFVAHPRKSDGFLRLDDVSGSSDLVNAVDTAFIMHRVNEDFKRLTQQTLKWRNDNQLYQCNNVLEICKDRASGVQDEFIPLWFELSSKRMKNNEYEHKVYKWELQAMGNDDSLPFE